MKNENLQPVTERLVGFGAHTLMPGHFLSWEDQEIRNREMLSHALNLHDTIIFSGAGCSVPLGFPTWQEFVSGAVKMTSAMLPPTNQYANHLAKFEKQVASKSSPSNYMFILGACESMWIQNDPSKGARTYREKLAEHFTARQILSNVCNPYDHLLELPVQRFVTSNYDCALEQAIAKKDGVPEKDYLPDGRCFGKQNFTQHSKYDEQLALFAIAKGDHDRKVFHCHGWHHEPKSMVITEADYQRWYLRDQHVGIGRFRQTIDLIFGSNPILFVGFSLRDDDLLLALRILSAVEPNRKHKRPLFALMEKESEDAETHFEQIYDRYGVHVISYQRRSKQSHDELAASLREMNCVDSWERANALCSELDKIAKNCRDHRAEWLKKPKFRRVPLIPIPPQPYFQYEYTSAKAQSSASPKAPDPLLSLLIDNVKKPDAPKIVALIGPGGTGKSWLALELLKKLSNSKRTRRTQIDGFFFWSSYYTNDALNGLDCALKYLQASPDPTESRVERLRQCLTSTRKKYVLVIDGVERYLHETREPGNSQSNRAIVGRLLEAVIDKGSNSTVLLTSRVVPTELRELEKDPTKKGLVKIISAQGFTVEQAESLINNKRKVLKLKTNKISSVVSWLNGHRYGIALAATWLQQSKPEADAFSCLLHYMAETDPEQRVSKMIGLSIEALTKDSRDLLEELAVFTAPVDKPTIEKCVEILPNKCKDSVTSTRMTGPLSKDDKPIKLVSGDLIEELTTRKILFQVKFEGNMCHYIVHPTVREYVFRNLHHSSAYDLPSLDLSGFTSGADLVYPGDCVGVDVVNALFTALHRDADPGFYLRKDQPQQTVSEDVRYRACRSLFSVVRCRMVANTVPRWTTYENYLSYLTRVIDSARNMLPRHWDYATRDRRDYAVKEERHRQPRKISMENGRLHSEELVFDDDGPLYADEVAWLYNEAGLAYYSQGSMLDAIAVWEQGYEINKVLDSEPEGGPYLFQSLCNLGAAHIHFGRLRIAESYLRHAFEIGRSIKETDHAARVKGYLGLVRHLQGNLEEAEELYKEAIMNAKEVGNLRAQSIFLKHHADLLIKKEQLKEAANQIQTSRAAAEAGHFLDLIAYARLSQGHLHRSRRQYPDAIRQYRVALAEARRLGIHRLEAEAHSELARVALDLGDAQVARRRAMKTLQIANEHILGLRQTHGMVILGNATVEAGERELGMHYLRHARRLAARQEYRIQYDEAEAALHRWGEPIEELETE